MLGRTPTDQISKTAPFSGLNGLLPENGIEDVRPLVHGLETAVPLLGGGTRSYVNLDNAATTPPLTPVLDSLRQFSEWYASAHRGTGFKSLLSTHVYEQCRRAVADFVGADLSHHTVIFVQNATHGLNKLARRLPIGPHHVVVTTAMEHHSNLLPWQELPCTVEYARVCTDDGSLDMRNLEERVRRNRGRLALVSVCGASNVTGAMPPLRRIARLAHQNGALVAVDATQLVPHRPFRMGAPDDPERFDFAAFSAHKMYAPFGSGVLIGPRAAFQEGVPDMVGGGTVQAVSLEETVWAEPPERDEAGTPNMLGALALAMAARLLQALNMEEVAEHERDLTRRLLRGLSELDGLTIYGLKDPALARDRIGVVTFNVYGMAHGHLAAALGYEWGIGVRNGCFCAQPYVRELLGLDSDAMRRVVRKLRRGDHATVPGMVRASLGIYNTKEEVDLFLEAMRRLIADGPKTRYVVDASGMGYVPETGGYDFETHCPV